MTLSKTRKLGDLLHHLFARSRCFAFLVLVNACAVDALAQDRDPVVDRALGSVYTSVKDLAPDQTRLVFYRSQGDGLGVINLHINGRYHTSLQSGAFSAVCLQHASVNLQALPGDRWTNEDAVSKAPQTVDLSGGQTLFFRLSQASAAWPRLDAVPVRVAAQEVQGTREQMHSLSRVAWTKPCQSVTAPSLAFAPHVINLNAQTLKNPTELAQLMSRLALQYSMFKSVSLHIVGYAYDLGSEAKNDRFSQELASEVQRFFLTQSTRFSPVTSEGRGSQAPQATTEQPSHRVEIGITVID